MRKIAILLIVLALASMQAFAEHDHEHLCSELDSGAEFGQHHAEHAQAGHLGKEMNPGMHKGYSPCVP